MLKPKHKFNGGRGATLCHNCNVIISEGCGDELLCENCNKDMTFENFKDLHELHYDEEGPLRKGQSLMYLLSSLQPEIYRKLTSTPDDCFYIDKLIPNALNKIEKLWPDNSAKYLFIGDIHCNFNILVQAVSYAWVIGANPVLLGDLVDHRVKGMTKSDGVRVLNFVLNLLQTNRGICLWGNHDLSYVNAGLHGCSEWTYSREKLYKPIYEQLLETGNFRPFVFLDKVNTLVTHAGLNPQLVGSDPILELEESFNDYPTALKERHKFLGHPGGITWLRKKGHVSTLPNNIQQVVGHTPRSKIQYSKSRSTWYVDTLNFGDKSLLLMTEGVEPQIIPFNKYANYDYN